MIYLREGRLYLLNLSSTNTVSEQQLNHPADVSHNHSKERERERLEIATQAPPLLTVQKEEMPAFQKET